MVFSVSGQLAMTIVDACWKWLRRDHVADSDMSAKTTIDVREKADRDFVGTTQIPCQRHVRTYADEASPMELRPTRNAARCQAKPIGRHGNRLVRSLVCAQSCNGCTGSAAEDESMMSDTIRQGLALALVSGSVSGYLSHALTDELPACGDPESHEKPEREFKIKSIVTHKF